MSENRSGAWDIPQKDYVKSFKLKVLIHNLETDEVDEEFEIDYGKPDDRKFLGKVTFWAATHNRSVETMSVDNWKKFG